MTISESLKAFSMGEGYEVVQTLHVSTKQRHICRIEVLHDVVHAGSYSARYYTRVNGDGPWTPIAAGYADHPSQEMATHLAIAWLSKWGDDHPGS